MLRAPLLPHSRLWIPLDSGILWTVDFRNSTVGPGGTLPNSLLFQRALNSVSGSETVQTSDTTMQSAGFTADVPRIGQYGTDNQTRGLVIEHSDRTQGPARNTNKSSTAWTWTNGSGGTIPSNTVNYVPPSGLSTPNTTGTTNVASRITAAANTKGQVASVGFGYNRLSFWLRTATGTANWAGALRDPTPIVTIMTATLGTDWQRIELDRQAFSGSFYVCCNDSTLIPGISTAAQDFVVDFVNTIGVANGYNFTTESINTGGSDITLTRNPERLYLANNAALIDNGRLSFEIRLRPKGAANQYGAAMKLFYIDASNYCEIDNTTQRMNLVMNGVSFNPATALNWNKKDILDLWVETGGGGLVSNLKYRTNNGTAVNLGSSGAPAPAIATGVAINLLCKSVLGTHSEEFTSWIQTMTAYKSGYRPSWAA